MARGLLWAGAAAALVALAHLAAAALPVASSTAAAAPRGAAVAALAEVTVGTVPPEEVAFSGVSWGLMRAENGAAAATVVYRADLARMVATAYGLPASADEPEGVERAARERERDWVRHRLVAEQLHRARKAVTRQLSAREPLPATGWDDGSRR